MSLYHEKMFDKGNAKSMHQKQIPTVLYFLDIC